MVALLCNNNNPHPPLPASVIVAFIIYDGDLLTLDTTSRKQTRDPLYTLYGSHKNCHQYIHFHSSILLYSDFYRLYYQILFVLEDRFCKIQRKIKLLGHATFEALASVNLIKEPYVYLWLTSSFKSELCLLQSCISWKQTSLSYSLSRSYIVVRNSP